MIAIVGHPILAAHGVAELRLVGLTAAIATAAVEAGAPVQLVGKVGDDPEGDQAVLALGRGGIGHVATLRDAAHRTPVVRADSTGARPAEANSLLDDHDDENEARFGWSGTLEPSDPAARPALEEADVELALRYLSDVTVVVVVELSAGITEVAGIEAAAAGAHLVVVLGAESAGGEAKVNLTMLPGDALVLQAPDHGFPDHLAVLVGRYAAQVDAGADPRVAFEAVAAGRAAEHAGS